MAAIIIVVFKIRSAALRLFAVFCAALEHGISARKAGWNWWDSIFTTPSLSPQVPVIFTVSARMIRLVAIGMLASNVTALFHVNRKVFLLAFNHYQILGSVIILNAVDVMDYFISFKKSAKHLFHYKPVLQNGLSAWCGERMIGANDSDIPRGISMNSPLVVFNYFRVMLSPFRKTIPTSRRLWTPCFTHFSTIATDRHIVPELAWFGEGMQ